MTGFPDDPRDDGRPPGPRGGSADGSSTGGSTGGFDFGRAFDRDFDRDFDLDRDLDGDFDRDLSRDLGRDLDGGGTGGADRDPLERLLRPPGEYLPPPPGAFERIRRKAARRRRNRAAAGGVVVVAMITGSVYLTGVLSPHDSDEVVGPPATSSQATRTSATPGPTGQAPGPAEPRPTTRTGSRPTPVATPTPPSTAPSATPGGPAPSTSGSTPMCTAAQLGAELGGSDAGAGNLYRYLVVTNRGSAACHLTGYPGLSLLDANGKEIGAPATRDQRSYQPVVLAPGGSASDTIHTANQMGTCLPASTSLRIYPPGSRASLVVPGSVTICDDLFTITPFTAGRTGNPSN